MHNSNVIQPKDVSQHNANENWCGYLYFVNQQTPLIQRNIKPW